jgi:hypothetical protein
MYCPDATIVFNLLVSSTHHHEIEDKEKYFSRSFLMEPGEVIPVMVKKDNLMHGIEWRAASSPFAMLLDSPPPLQLFD